MIDLDCSEKEEDMYLEYLSEVDISLILYRKIFGRVEGTVKEQRVNAIEKYCYDKCLEASWTKKELNEIAYFLGVTVATIKKYAKGYMLRNNISIDVRNSAINDKMKERSRNSRQNMLMDALCSANTKEEIIKVIEDSGLKNKTLKLAASDYVNLYKKDEGEVLLSSLKAKIDIYRHYLSDNYKKEKEEEKIRYLKIKQEEQFNNLGIAREIVKSFIDSDCKLITDYVKSISLDIETLKIALS